jgi:hypothetical protein
LNLLVVNQSGPGNGVSGRSDAGIGVAGTGLFGVQGISSAANGTGLFGWAASATGSTRGLYAQANSPNGTAGVFDNPSGSGLLLLGSVNGSHRFKVDATGAVYANSYRDLAGNPLTGGLDIATADVRYAAFTHTHTVSQVTGAATLNSNVFTGDQTISGNVQGRFGTFTNGLHSSATDFGDSAIVGTFAGQWGNGVVGITSATQGAAAGVYGIANATAGAGSVHGVLGESAGLIGAAVRGLARQNVGVEGITQGATGTAILAQALATTGNTTGVLVHNASPTGTAVKLQSSGGDMIIGQNIISGARFRIDATGNVFANAFNVGGADFAESMAVTESKEQYEPGDAMIIDSGLRRTLTRSSSPYSTKVAGVYSTKPGVVANPYGVDDPRVSAEIPLAVVGIVPCKVTAENGAIEAGDLLVTSSLAGHAMKGTDASRMVGAVLGKALEPLAEGTGTILVLVTIR